MSHKLTVFKDETDNFSTARILLWIWTVVIIIMLFGNPAHLTQAILTFLSSVYLFLSAWAAGPRMAAYLAPQISKVAQAIGQAKTVTVSSDIQELSAQADNFEEK